MVYGGTYGTLPVRRDILHRRLGFVVRGVLSNLSYVVSSLDYRWYTRPGAGQRATN